MAKCFIVEGVDRAGKDTIVKNLYQSMKKQPHIIHCVGIKKATVEESISASRLYYSQMFDIVKYCLNMLNVDVILNRSHIGDMVYPQIYRGCTEEQCSYIYDLETLPVEQVCGIYVMANPDILIERDDGLSQSENDKIKIIRELNLFDIAISKSRYDFTQINTTFTTEEDLHETLKDIYYANLCR
jgi:thymidylate kinase